MNALQKLVIHHPIFKFKNSKLILDDIGDMDYSKVNQYEPMNLPSIMSALLSYIDLHDLLKLLMLSKTFRLTIIKEEFKINTTIEKILKNAADHQCMKCVQLLYTVDHLLLMFVACCQTGNKEYYKMIQNDLYRLRSVKNGPLAPRDFNTITLHECIKGLLKLDSYLKKDLFNHLLDKNINNIETLSLIIATTDEYYIKKICANITDINKEAYLILLPYLCQYNFRFTLEKNIDWVTDLNELYELMQNRYDHEVMRSLFRKLLSENYPFEDVVYWATLYYDERILELVLTNYDCDLTPLISLAYQFDLQTYYNLDHNKEENKLSIELSSKYTLYTPRTIYTSFLTVEEMINQLLSISNKYVQYELIRHISNIVQIDDVIIPLINWIEENEVKEGLLLMDKINEKLKLKLVPLAYKHNESEQLTFLKNSKEYNLLSVQEADKHYMNNYIYVNHLNNEDLLKLLVTVQNKYIKKILIYHIKPYLIKTIYKNETKNRSTYQLTRYNDGEIVELYYQLKLDISCIEKIKQCIEMDEQIYFEIFRQLCHEEIYRVHIIQYLIEDFKFKQTNTEDMIKLLKYYPSNISMINDLLKHPFFDAYKDV